MSNLTLPKMTNFTEASEFLGGVDARKMGHNTHAHRHTDASIAVSYHKTDIVTYYPDGSIWLDHGGWATSTTVNRMHMLTPDTIRVNGHYPKRDQHSITVTVLSDSGDAVVHPLEGATEFKP